jgi:hypothetical protein
MKISYSACIVVAAFSVAHAQDYYGKFEGELLLRPLSGNNGMRLEKDYSFIDPSGDRWDAPAGTVTDGASIPRFLWTVAGNPWGADYRNAAVIHDVACKEKKRSWEAVHLNFYYAMRTAGVPPRKAKIMYTAVYHFGPKWVMQNIKTKVPEVGSTGIVLVPEENFSEILMLPLRKHTQTMDEEDYKKIEESVKLLEKQRIDEGAQLVVLRRDETVED